ncbi:MAG: hypothetical protein WCE68_13640 [Anaerolineales bacterium]
MDALSTSGFWDFLDQLVAACPVRIDRPRNTPHPRYPAIVYPLDYGYLEGTTAADGGGMDVWLGVSGTHTISAILVTVDMLKRDSEIKILLGCTEEEIQATLSFHNLGKYMRAVLVRRPIIQGDII